MLPKNVCEAITLAMTRPYDRDPAVRSALEAAIVAYAEEARREGRREGAEQAALDRKVIDRAKHLLPSPSPVEGDGKLPANSVVELAVIRDFYRWTQEEGSHGAHCPYGRSIGDHPGDTSVKERREKGCTCGLWDLEKRADALLNGPNADPFPPSPEPVEGDGARGPIHWLGDCTDPSDVWDLSRRRERFMAVGSPTTLYVKQAGGQYVLVPLGSWIYDWHTDHPLVSSDGPAPSDRAAAEGDGARGEVLPEIAAFARVMDAKIKGHNIDRGEYGWRTASPARLMEWLDRYVEALRDAVTLPSLARDPAKVTSKAANIANLAMMIADVAGDLDAAATPEPLRMSPAEYDRAVEILKDETPPPAGLIDLFTPSEPAAEFCTKCGAEGVEPHRGECLPTTVEGDGARGNVHKENDR